MSIAATSACTELDYPLHPNISGSISVSGQLPTYSSPNSTLTLTCYQLTVVELGEG